MKIIYYETNTWIDEGRLLGSLVHLGLRTEALLPYLSVLPFFNKAEFDLVHLVRAIGQEIDSKKPTAERILLGDVQGYMKLNFPGGKYGIQTQKIIDLLIKVSHQGAQPGLEEISVNSLLGLFAYTYGLDVLNIGSVFAQALPFSSNPTLQDKTVHGIYAICQTRVLPAKSDGVAITPVAAAILSTLVEFEVPPFRFLQSIEPQSGQEISGVQSLHVIVGEMEITEDKDIVLIQTNIDDMSAQLLSHAINRLFEAGALDIYQTPIYMKKNRLGVQLNVVVRQRDEAELAKLILRETTTLGVNVRVLDHRYHAEVRMVTVETKYGSIPVKQKYLDGVLIQSKPEYEVTAKIVSEFKISMDELHHEVEEQLRLKINSI